MALEYGPLWFMVISVVGALIWFMKTVTTKLLSIIESNTAALTKLEATIREAMLNQSNRR